MKNCLHKFKIFKNGFTLAEVLITLVVIGVVAALTIPTAINKMQDQERKTQFAKAYSSFSQALRKTVMNDFYGYVRCAYYWDVSTGSYDFSKTETSDCRAFYNAFAKNLSVQKVCKGNSLADGCIPVYKSINPSSGCSGFSENNVNNVNYSYVLSDGQIIITYGAGGGALFLFDINGHKGPNAYGKDLFAVNIANRSDNLSGYYLEPKYSCEFPVSGGKYTQEMMLYSLAGKK